MTTIEPHCHNKPFREMSEQELREELAYWQQKITTSMSWGSALGAAQEFVQEIRQILSARSLTHD